MYVVHGHERYVRMWYMGMRGTYVYLEILATFLIWRFGVQDQNRQISITKFTKTYLLCFVLAVQLPNLIFANIKIQPDLAQIAKFNDRQYFRIYGMYVVHGHERYVCMYIYTLTSEAFSPDV